MGNMVIRMLMTQLAQRYSSKKNERFLIVFGTFYLFAGITLYYFLNDVLLNTWLEWIMQLKPNGMILNIWQQTNLTIKVWLFNIENGEKFVAGTQNIRIREIGPFCFHGHRQRTIIDWPLDYDLIRYNESFHYEFDPKQSVGPLSTTMIKTINLPLLMILGFIHRNSSSYLNVNLTEWIKDNNELIIEKSVGEILGIINMNTTTNDDDDSGGNEFGFTFFDSDEIYGPIESYTGYRMKRNFNQYYRYQDRKEFENFQHIACNRLKGTEGSFFGLDKHPDDFVLNIFNPHIASCRSFRFVYNGLNQIDWIQTQRYQWDLEQFSLKYYADNWCYCPEYIDDDDEECDGRFYLNQCSDDDHQQQWLLMTNVHFLHTTNLARIIRGLRPDPLKHQSYIEMEPRFGATIDSRLRIQYNFNLMQPYKFYENFNLNFHHKPSVIPFIWIEECYTMNDGFFKFLLQFCSSFLIIISYFYAFIATFGVCLILIGLIRLLKKFIKRRTAVKNDDNGDDDGDKEKF
ncbi:cd36-like protein [Dermatophagoides farinae]|uniref:Scavenger receptor class B member 1 n=1 Tax=Dermatophagoides farinae TaxID=6954 RepID=A0A9D4SE12_DERFA|nr:platelet glycoprotein 4-like [Dermatophagoides farinae]KAH7638243.1 cd36-like protein [Dermatophagoides farinae]